MIENIIQILLLYILFSNFREDYFQIIVLFLHYANKALWPIYKVLFKNLLDYENILLIDLKCCLVFYKILGIGLN
jgi:hypothetical protein